MDRARRDLGTRPMAQPSISAWMTRPTSGGGRRTGTGAGTPARRRSGSPSRRGGEAEAGTKASVRIAAPGAESGRGTALSREGIMRTHRWLGIGLVLLGTVIAATALLGPLVADVIRYHTSETTVNQLIGADATALVVIAPFCILAGVLALRGHAAGPVLALPAAVYAAYNLHAADRRSGVPSATRQQRALLPVAVRRLYVRRGHRGGCVAGGERGPAPRDVPAAGPLGRRCALRRRRVPRRPASAHPRRRAARQRGSSTCRARRRSGWSS